jgi:hypothetical protein
MNNKVFEQIKKCTSEFIANDDETFETKKEAEAFFRKYHEPIKTECDFYFFVNLCLIDLKFNFVGGTMI